MGEKAGAGLLWEAANSPEVWQSISVSLGSKKR